MSTHTTPVANPRDLPEDDPILKRLAAFHPTDPTQQIGGVESALPDRVFDLQIRTPQAWRLTALHEMLDMSAVPSPQSGNLLLISHEITPFPPFGQLPVGVWGIGYRATFPDCPGLKTTGTLPTTRHYKQAGLNVTLGASLDTQGQFGLTDKGADLIRSAGIPVPPTASVGVSAGAGAYLVINLELKLLEVETGSYAGNGVQWNMYRPRESLAGAQAFFQTVLVPSDAPSPLKIKVESWVRARRWFGRAGTAEWTAPERPYEVQF